MRDNKQAKEVEEVSGSQLKEENRILRYLIGMSHDGPKHRIYGDDGELQCSACRIDFVRDSAQDIQRKIEEAGMRELQRAMDAQESGHQNQLPATIPSRQYRIVEPGRLIADRILYRCRMWSSFACRSGDSRPSGAADRRTNGSAFFALDVCLLCATIGA